MKKSYSLWILILVFMVLIGGASFLYNRLGEQYQPEQLATQPVEETQAATEEPKSYAPDFTAVDGEGNEVHLSDFMGKPVVLNFWASWCGPCKMEMPDFNEAYLEQGGEIQFLMVNMTDGAQETLEGAKEFIADSGYSFPVLFDTGYEAAIAYGVSSIPATYFIDSEGSLVARAVGAIDAETLQRGISMIANE